MSPLFDGGDSGGDKQTETDVPVRFETKTHEKYRIRIPERIIQERKSIQHRVMVPKRYLVSSPRGKRMILPASSRFLQSASPMRRFGFRVLGATTLKPAFVTQIIPEIKIPEFWTTIKKEKTTEVTVHVDFSTLFPSEDSLEELISPPDIIIPDGRFIIPDF